MSSKPNKTEIKNSIKFWLDSAIDNLETARAMLRSKRYNFAMFMCQQTLEALLKCSFIKLKNERPPHIHKLPRLLTLIGIEIPVWADKTILKVDAHYVKARYFEDRFNRQIYNAKNASALLKQTKKVLKWFVKELKLER